MQIFSLQNDIYLLTLVLSLGECFFFFLLCCYVVLEDNYEIVKQMANDFVETFTDKTEKMVDRHDEQRVKLFFDRGQSSLRNNKRRRNTQTEVYHRMKHLGFIEKRMSTLSIQSAMSAESSISLSPRKEDDIEANRASSSSECRQDDCIIETNIEDENEMKIIHPKLLINS